MYGTRGGTRFARVHRAILLGSTAAERYPLGTRNLAPSNART